jgi:hypothetical protein
MATRTSVRPSFSELIPIAAATWALVIVGPAQGQQPADERTATATKQTTPGPGSVRDDRGAAQAPDMLVILEAHLEAKRTLLRIDESRVQQAKRWKDYYERMVRDGKVLEDRLLAAREDILMLDAHVAAERAELGVAETRLKYARLHAAHGDQAAGGVDRVREELEALQALLDAKRLLVQVGESRAAEAKRVRAHYEKLFRDGMATEDRVLAANDDVLLMEAILAWGRADLKVTELRVKDAQQLASSGRPAADAAERRLAAFEERLGEAEMRANLLQHEVGRLRRELPRESRGAR